MLHDLRASEFELTSTPERRQLTYSTCIHHLHRGRREPTAPATSFSPSVWLTLPQPYILHHLWHLCRRCLCNDSPWPTASDFAVGTVPSTAVDVIDPAFPTLRTADDTVVGTVNTSPLRSPFTMQQSGRKSLRQPYSPPPLLVWLAALQPSSRWPYPSSIIMACQCDWR